MDTYVSIQRPRPQNLAMNFSGSISDLKCFTASLKIPQNDWAKSCRSTSSATLKNNSLYDSEFTTADERADLERQFKEQIEIFKKKNDLEIQQKMNPLAMGKLSECYSSKGNSDSDTTTKNLSPSKSALELEEKEKQISELLGEIERQKEYHQQMVAEKNQKIERLQSDLHKMSEEKNNEKESRISLLEEEIKSLVPEDLEVLIDQINQHKTDKTILAEELDKTMEKVEMLTSENELLRRELHNKIKSIEEKAQKDLDILKQGFLEKIDDMEREKMELVKQLGETRELLQRSSLDADSVGAEMFQIIQKLQDEKQALLAKLDENENVLRTSLNDIKMKEAEFEDTRTEMQKEISVLQYELNECKLESLSYINDLKEQNTCLKESINEIDEEKYRLEEKFNDYVHKFDSSLKEISDLREIKEKHAAKEIEALDMLQLEQKLTIEKDVLLMRLEQSERNYGKQIFELEETLTSKDHYIEGLLAEVSQLKKIIEAKHREAAEEKETKEKSYLVEEMSEIKELEEKETPRQSPEKQGRQEPEATQQETSESTTREQVNEIQETKEPVKNKVIVYYIEKSSHNRYRNYYDSYEAPAVKSNRRTNRNSKSMKAEQQVVYQPKRAPVPLTIQVDEDPVDESQNQFDLKSASCQTPSSATNRLDTCTSMGSRNERASITSKSKKSERRPKEEDPVYKQLEKMVMDLNEKLFTSDKRAKAFYEEKLKETSQQHVESQQNLLNEIDKLRNENKELLKKIDDVQWEKAYEYTERKKLEKMEEDKALEAAKKSQVAAADAKKKKKNPNNKSISVQFPRAY